MSIFKKQLPVTMLCLLLSIAFVQCLPAADEGGKETADIPEKGAPSFSIKGSNVTVTPAVKTAGQEATQVSGKGAAPGGDQPHLSIDVTDYNVGEVWEGEDIVHTFTVKNTGKAQLDITNVKAG